MHNTMLGRAAAILAILIVSSAASPALAFGAAGHEAVCEIAYKELTPAGKQMVDTIMSAETDEHFKSFHAACVWPDTRTGLTNARRSEHFINVPRDWRDIPADNCVGADTCLFTAIPLDIAVLKDPNATKDAKLAALKFLGHWVGDIHQPLHVSFADDRGGNDISVEGVPGCSRDGETKLHSVWDTCIANRMMHDLHVGTDRAAFGDALQSAITDEQRAKWRASLLPLDWANESFAVARTPNVEYCVMVGDRCQYSVDTEQLAPDGTQRVVAPPGDYNEEFSPVISERLQAAGVRLGALLNGIAANGAP